MPLVRLDARRTVDALRVVDMQLAMLGVAGLGLDLGLGRWLLVLDACSSLRLEQQVDTECTLRVSSAVEAGLGALGTLQQAELAYHLGFSRRAGQTIIHLICLFLVFPNIGLVLVIRLRISCS